MNLKPTVALDTEALWNWYEYGEPFTSTLQYCNSIVRNNQHLFE